MQTCNRCGFLISSNDGVCENCRYGEKAVPTREEIVPPPAPGYANESTPGAKTGVGGGAEPWPCELCEAPVEGYEPEYCCAGLSNDCYCLGRPTNPCTCSEECDKALFAGIGTTMEARRIAAGIPWRGGWMEKTRRTDGGSSHTVKLCRPADSEAGAQDKESNGH